MFEPRDVQVGERVEDKAQILSGLKPGDMVAVSGGYLLDSESQLKGSGGGHENMPVPAPAQPKKKNDLKMDDMKM